MVTVNKICMNTFCKLIIFTICLNPQCIGNFQIRLRSEAEEYTQSYLQNTNRSCIPNLKRIYEQTLKIPSDSWSNAILLQYCLFFEISKHYFLRFFIFFWQNLT